MIQAAQAFGASVAHRSASYYLARPPSRRHPPFMQLLPVNITPQPPPCPLPGPRAPPSHFLEAIRLIFAGHDGPSLRGCINVAALRLDGSGRPFLPRHSPVTFFRKHEYPAGQGHSQDIMGPSRAPRLSTHARQSSARNHLGNRRARMHHAEGTWRVILARRPLAARLAQHGRAGEAESDPAAELRQALSLKSFLNRHRTELIQRYGSLVILANTHGPSQT